MPVSMQFARHALFVVAVFSLAAFPLVIGQAAYNPSTLDAYSSPAADLTAFALSAASNIHVRRAAARKSTSQRLPVVFVPSLLGNRLEYKDTDRRAKCARSFGRWSELWVDGALDDPECFLRNLRFDVSRTASGGFLAVSPPGVETRPEASFDAAMRLTKLSDRLTPYEHFAEALESLGWRRGYDIDALNYDWRRGPDDWMSRGGAYDDLKVKIEALVARAGRPVILLSLSMGGPFTTLFLGQHVSADWKAKNVARLVSLSGSFGGSLTAFEPAITGYTSDVQGPLPSLEAVLGARQSASLPAQLRYVADHLILRLSNVLGTAALPTVLVKLREPLARTTRSWGSILWQGPDPQVEPVAGRLLLKTKGQRFAVEDQARIFEALGDQIAADRLRLYREQRFQVVSNPPGVELHCLIGSDLPIGTSVTLDLPLGRYDQIPTLTDDKRGGDLEVTTRSLTYACERWAATNGSTFIQSYSGISHRQILAHRPAFETFLALAFADP